MPYFDYWVHTDSKGFFKHILVSKDSKEDIWKKPWCDELMEKIETNGDIEEVINAKNQKLYEAFAADERPAERDSRQNSRSTGWNGREIVRGNEAPVDGIGDPACGVCGKRCAPAAFHANGMR